METALHVLAIIADFAGVVGFFLALWTLRVARSVKATQDRFVNQARVPELLQELSSANSALSKVLGTTATNDQHRRIVEIEAILQSLHEKVPRTIQQEISSALSISGKIQTAVDATSASDLHAKVHKVCTLVSNHFKDEKVRGGT